MRGFQSLMATIAIESIVGSREWFSQGLALNNLQLYALGQVKLEHQGARLNWLLPLNATEKDPLPELLDNLAMEAGLRGAKYMTASASVEDCLFETLRRAGYCRIGWQSIWEVRRDSGKSHSPQFSWFKPDSANALEINNLQRKLLSPATQAVTAFASQVLPDFALKIDGCIKGYAKVSGFNNKVIIAPILDNNLQDSVIILSSLVEKFFHAADAVYMLQTADSGGLTADLEKIGVRKTPRYELLVKHFAAMQKLPAAELNHNGSGHRADTITPLMPSAGRKDNI